MFPEFIYETSESKAIHSYQKSSFLLRSPNISLEIFVSWVGDLATIGGSVWSWPRFVQPLVPTLFVCEALEIRKFYPGSSLAFWPSGVPEGSSCEQDAQGGPLLSGHVLGGSVSALPVFSL